MRTCRSIPLLLLVAAAIPLAGCGGGDAPPATVTVTASADPSPTESATATEEPSETAEPTPTEPPVSDVVELTAAGVGDLPWDAPDATAAVTALLGPAESSEAFPSECGPTDVQTLRWGSVKVHVQSDTLMAWEVDRWSSVPEGIGLPGDVITGSPWSAVTALPGAQPATFLDNYQLFQVAVQAPGDAEAIYYVAQADEPDAPVFGVHARMILGCG